MAETSPPLERHFQYFRRTTLLALIFYVVLGIGTVAALMTPGLQPAYIIVPGVAFIGAFVAHHLVMRKRGWLEPDPAGHTLAGDEWVKEIHHRSNRIAVWTGFFGQVPLMFFVAYVQVEPTAEGSVIGMGMLTMVLMGITLWISYLYYTRPQADV